MKNPQTTEALLQDQIERINNSEQSNDVIDFINDINEETKYYELKRFAETSTNRKY